MCVQILCQKCFCQSEITKNEVYIFSILYQFEGGSRFLELHAILNSKLCMTHLEIRKTISFPLQNFITSGNHKRNRNAVHVESSMYVDSYPALVRNQAFICFISPPPPGPPP